MKSLDQFYCKVNLWWSSTMMIPPQDGQNEFLTRIRIETSARLKIERFHSLSTDKALIIENMEVTHSNIELNGFELNAACAVTMNGQSYIFQAVKRRTVDRDTGFPEGRPYVLLLGGVRRLLIPSIFHMIESSLPKDIYAIRPTLFLDPNSRELKFYSKMRDLYGLSTCVNWSPGSLR